MKYSILSLTLIATASCAKLDIIEFLKRDCDVSQCSAVIDKAQQNCASEDPQKEIECLCSNNDYWKALSDCSCDGTSQSDIDSYKSGYCNQGASTENSDLDSMAYDDNNYTPPTNVPATATEDDNSEGTDNVADNSADDVEDSSTSSGSEENGEEDGEEASTSLTNSIQTSTSRTTIATATESASSSPISIEDDDLDSASGAESATDESNSTTKGSDSVSVSVSEDSDLVTDDADSATATGRASSSIEKSGNSTSSSSRSTGSSESTVTEESATETGSTSATNGGNPLAINSFMVVLALVLA
ncbi:hypothetical protein PICST_28690 [Scheffersomyces stipitis CBS 6054]|uniref:Cell wall protein n=1 Tax=Scheffersomyces stipitis (strain ATCC 58785 / CBS 6054 / NBRC 10063 / NRRL Y-11545) TaxID=322104 RepID=A3GGP9_PICST|nr:hypothetical protein PICST_28690 [Scheffersomyces stipitis CBS 6054]EAZ63963.2 hypothetical protein PICST_28690 [Scheffersomyces stipitis CBS 6054]